MLHCMIHNLFGWAKTMDQLTVDWPLDVSHTGSQVESSWSSPCWSIVTTGNSGCSCGDLASRCTGYFQGAPRRCSHGAKNPTHWSRRLVGSDFQLSELLFPFLNVCDATSQHHMFWLFGTKFLDESMRHQKPSKICEYLAGHVLAVHERYRTTIVVQWEYRGHWQPWQ